MFHFLVDELPNAIALKGIEYRINTDFTYFLSLFRLVYNTDESFLFSDQEKMETAVDLIYIDTPPYELMEDAYKEIFNFVSMYREDDSQTGGIQAPPIFDYLEDSELIFSAFYQQYHIDLLEVKMHWFKFSALLSNINDGKPSLVSVMDIRGMKDKDIRKHEPEDQIAIRKLKQRLKIKSADYKEVNAEREAELDNFLGK